MVLFLCSFNLLFTRNYISRGNQVLFKVNILPLEGESVYTSPEPVLPPCSGQLGRIRSSSDKYVSCCIQHLEQTLLNKTIRRILQK